MTSHQPARIQLHHLLLELIPGGAKKNLSAAQAKVASCPFGGRSDATDDVATYPAPISEVIQVQQAQGPAPRRRRAARRFLEQVAPSARVFRTQDRHR